MFYPNVDKIGVKMIMGLSGRQKRRILGEIKRYNINTFEGNVGSCFFTILGWFKITVCLVLIICTR